MLKILHEYDETIICRKPNPRVLVMADLHEGSTYGFLPSNARIKDGRCIPQNPQQRKIEKNLHAELTKVGNVDILIIDGDICEGKQVKIGGVSLSDADTDTMVNWAVQTIEDICSVVHPETILICKGTDYHSTNMIGGDLDYQVANSLSSTHEVYYGLPIAIIKIGKLWWRISHRYPTSRNITPPMESFYKDLCADAKIKKYRVPDVFVWAHAHQCIEPHRIISTSAYGMLCPCLKMNDPYISEKFYPKRPDIGFIFVEQNDDYLNGYFRRVFP